MNCFTFLQWAIHVQSLTRNSLVSVALVSLRFSIKVSTDAVEMLSCCWFIQYKSSRIRVFCSPSISKKLVVGDQLSCLRTTRRAPRSNPRRDASPSSLEDTSWPRGFILKFGIHASPPGLGNFTVKALRQTLLGEDPSTPVALIIMSKYRNNPKPIPMDDVATGMVFRLTEIQGDDVFLPKDGKRMRNFVE